MPCGSIWRVLDDAAFGAGSAGETNFGTTGVAAGEIGSQRSLRWREMDSNFRFRAKGATDLSFRFCLCP
jgi:hypothetical protein